MIELSLPAVLFLLFIVSFFMALRSMHDVYKLPKEVEKLAGNQKKSGRISFEGKKIVHKRIPTRPQ